MARTRTFVIVGASLAGAKAAETLRTEGFDGEIVLVGAEPVRPYERPPLSKDYLRGEVDFEGPAVHASDFYATNDIDLRLSTTVTEIDPKAALVTLQNGDSLAYDALLLATGAEPRRLSCSGADLPGVHYLRTVEESDHLRTAIKTAAPVVVIGAGWIGSEVAASARQLGASVSVVEPAAVPLARVLGDDVGAIYRDLHAGHGVDLHFGVGVEAIAGKGAVEEVQLTDGTKLDAGTVVVGVGVLPRSGLAEAAGLEIGNGVVTDEFLATSAPGVFAAGDVASARHPHYRTHVRLEHWSSALNQGPVAAKNMLGRKVAYEKLPYFFSDQYDLGMEYRGFAPEFDEVLFRGDRKTREFIAFWLTQGKVVAAMNANISDQGEHIEALLRHDAAVDRGRLADPDVELSDLGS